MWTRKETCHSRVSASISTNQGIPVLHITALVVPNHDMPPPHVCVCVCVSLTQVVFEHVEVPYHAVLVLCVIGHVPKGHIALVGGPRLVRVTVSVSLKWHDQD